jgi:hypothetical protein
MNFKWHLKSHSPIGCPATKSSGPSPFDQLGNNADRPLASHYALLGLWRMLKHADGVSAQATRDWSDGRDLVA